jgi:lysozyme family protein
MADFVRALPFVLVNEGGKCDLKGDSGGRTNAGVSTPALLDFNQRHPEQGFPDDPWALTPEQIATFYHIGYWKFDGVNDQACATKIMDMDVNDGLPSGIGLAQQAVNHCGQNVVVDDHYGPGTEAAINSCDPDALMDALIKVYTDHYEHIAAVHENDKPFLADWLRRAAKIPNP